MFQILGQNRICSMIGRPITNSYNFVITKNNIVLQMLLINKQKKPSLKFFIIFLDLFLLYNKLFNNFINKYITQHYSI